MDEPVLDFDEEVEFLDDECDFEDFGTKDDEDEEGLFRM